jgi:uncharacterized metal-binding protein YceD (DUF177 family)
MTDNPYPLSRRQPVDNLPANGFETAIEANEAERRALAEVLDILGIDSLKATFTLTPWRRGGVRVTGVVEADVVQACVLTLDPVNETVREDIDLRFLPEGELPPPRAEIELDVTSDDIPEPLEGGSIDLGAIAAEHMALGLDPYPRAPGAEFEPYVEDADEPKEAPFAALARLKGDEKS